MRLEPEEVKGDQGRVWSNAWPEEAASQIEAKAEAHKLLKANVERINLRNIYFRRLSIDDIGELKNLHDEWFPMNYQESFYQRVLKKNVIAVGCFVKSMPTPEHPVELEITLGAILTKVRPNDPEAAEILQQRGQGNYLVSWLSWIKRMVTCAPVPGAYIMTLGVVDECRRLGIGTKLIDQTISILRNEYQTCHLLYLHVVRYNETAIKFY